MSHEIRTPMNAVLGYAQILQRDDTLPSRHRKAIDTIEKSGYHLLSLIDEILDLSKIESGRMDVHASDFDLNELISGLSAMFHIRCEQKRLGWKVEGPGEGVIPVHADKSKLTQVLINLVGNAVKFTDAGKVRLSIARIDDHSFRFEVIDTGSGIPAEARDKIFEPFTQGSEGMKKGGTGLGLAISRRQIELMGGRLEVDSEVGHGSRFFFTVPLPPAVGEVVSAAKTQRRKILRLKESTPIRALVVDDIEENRDVLSALLRGLGAEVAVAHDGREAVDKVAAQPFDIVFLDIQMREMDGLEAARRIQAQRAAGRVRLVAISSSVLLHEQMGYFAIGFDDVVPKPFRLERLCECLEKTLGASFLHSDDGPAPASPTPPKDFSHLSVPADLLRRLRDAAEFHQYHRHRTMPGAPRRPGRGRPAPRRPVAGARPEC
jgi:CheY-like chemotaxis protein